MLKIIAQLFWVIILLKKYFDVQSMNIYFFDKIYFDIQNKGEYHENRLSKTTY